MNARVSAADQNTTILVEFSADSGFAYTAAQKPEVQELEQSIGSWCLPLSPLGLSFLEECFRANCTNVCEYC